MAAIITARPIEAIPRPHTRGSPSTPGSFPTVPQAVKSTGAPGGPPPLPPVDIRVERPAAEGDGEVFGTEGLGKLGGKVGQGHRIAVFDAAVGALEQLEVHVGHADVDERVPKGLGPEIEEPFVALSAVDPNGA